MDFFAGRHLHAGTEYDHIVSRRKRAFRQAELKAVVWVVREIEAIQIDGRIARIDQFDPVRKLAAPIRYGCTVAAHPLGDAKRFRLRGDIVLVSGAPIRGVGIARRRKSVRLQCSIGLPHHRLICRNCDRRHRIHTDAGGVC